MARPRGDHDSRRRLVVHATCRLIARHGVEGATVRAVARELGVATKAVTRYFRSKDEMLLLALDHVIAEQMKLSTGAGSLVGLLSAALPTTDKVRNGWRIWVAFLGEAVGNPALQRQHRKRYATLSRLMLQELRRHAQAGTVSKAAATPVVAEQLLALVDGIGMREAVNPGSIPVRRQRQMIASSVRRLPR